ncbi:phosphoribosylamine--glycine ligase [Anopheles sinensis]|uniref:Phosphoribosylamine--glycine ligase n=1 Tax=Anopheles sinensis TaxID=74873 RepID=A0A084WMC4_ANOSI|nr:phosphoribosylamine--glycine ligase [Anopheles sinensis]
MDRHAQESSQQHETINNLKRASKQAASDGARTPDRCTKDVLTFFAAARERPAWDDFTKPLAVKPFRVTGW